MSTKLNEHKYSNQNDPILKRAITLEFLHDYTGTEGLWEMDEKK